MFAWLLGEEIIFWWNPTAVDNIIDREVGTGVGQEEETDAEELHVSHSPEVISVNGSCHVVKWMTGSRLMCCLHCTMR
jgi:hypothetical protein